MTSIMVGGISSITTNGNVDTQLGIVGVFGTPALIRRFADGRVWIASVDLEVFYPGFPVMHFPLPKLPGGANTRSSPPV